MKILYLMHINWNWIKQRPQFLAERLSKKNDVFVFFPSSNRKKRNEYTDVNSKLFLIPFKKIRGEGRFSFIYRINSFVRRIIIFLLNKRYKFDCVWLCHPTFIDSVPCSMQNKMVYDCMDDHLSMTNLTKYKKRIIVSEKKLLLKSRHVFFTSNHLMETVQNRNSINLSNCSLVRNGFENDEVACCCDSFAVAEDSFNITYFGTISSWFDWDSIVFALNSVDNLFVHIIGAKDNDGKIPSHERIKYYGRISHELLYNFSKKTDCFIMPFVLNNTILSVDPVKLYEYISFSKNIITIKYEEINRFSPFVFMYENKEELVKIIRHLMAKNKLKYSSEQAINFLSSCSWENRCSLITKVLNNVFISKKQ